ncbi:hypothetical protein [Maribacter sp. 2-571]|uniref:hypothetical protein n=1 Tax=Maribacter sp. 2-571 TaxID=3417569 RepID=UPI003D32EB05
MVSAVALAYSALDFLQMNDYFHLRCKKSTLKGTGPETLLEMLCEINRQLQTKTGNSYAQVGISNFNSAYESVSKHDRYVSVKAKQTRRFQNQKNFSQKKGTLFITKFSVGFAETKVIFRPFSWKRHYSFVQTPVSEHQIFESGAFPANFKPMHLVATTSRAVNVLRNHEFGEKLLSDIKVPSDYVYVDFERTEAYLDIAIESCKIIRYYDFDDIACFTKEIWLAVARVDS